MGANCCGEDRKGELKNGQVHEKKRKMKLDVPPVKKERPQEKIDDPDKEINEQANKIVDVEQTPGEVGYLDSQEDETPLRISIYSCKHASFVAAWKKELILAYNNSIKEGKEHSFPFLITSFIDREISVLIFSKQISVPALKKEKELVEASIIDKCIQKSFVATSKSSTVFLYELNTFIKKASAEHLDPFGCVNDFKNSFVFYFYFFKNDNQTDEFLPFDDKKYECLHFEPHVHDVAILLTEWANKGKYYYRLSFPVYESSSNSLLYHAAVLEKDEEKKSFNYLVVDSPAKEELNEEIEAVEINQEFVGLMTDIKKNSIIYNIEKGK